jgi:hypothetical protein
VSKLRWEGKPSVRPEALGGAGCSALVVGLVALGALGAFCLGDRGVSYAWPAPAGTAVLGLVCVVWQVLARSLVRYRVTTSGVAVSTPAGEKAYLVPRDARLAVSACQGGSVHLGEVPFEERDRKGRLLQRGTECLRLGGLGPEAPLVARALEEARSDEAYPAFVPPLRGWRRRFVAARGTLALPGFLRAMPFEVSPAAARAVRGALARFSMLPVDAILPREPLEELAIYEPFSLWGDLEASLDARIDLDVLEAAIEAPGATVLDLALAVTRAGRPGGRPRPRG